MKDDGLTDVQCLLHGIETEGSLHLTPTKGMMIEKHLGGKRMRRSRVPTYLRSECSI